MHAKKQRFGRSCEASQISGQMSLFETTEELVQVLEKEEEKISVPTYTRKPRKPGVRKEIKDVFQSSTIKNLYIRGWWDDFDYEFNKMISLENFHLWGSVDKINFQSLIELDNIKSVCLGQVDVIDEELFKETYTVELANEIAKHKKISAFMMPMGREYVYKFNQIYDREFSKILYEAGIKESAYSYYKWHGVNVDEDLTIDEYVGAKI